jgi:beta-xylosidase
MMKNGNHILWTDIPDVDVIAAKDTSGKDAYYMSSTTMYFCPGVPIMKSYDLIHWNIVNYVYDRLEDDGEETMNLLNGKNAYGKGSWASSLREHAGVFYVSFVANNTGKTYIYKTTNIDEGPWQRCAKLEGLYHDMSLLFDTDDEGAERVFMVYGGGTIKVIELLPDCSGLKPGGLNQIIIPHADVAGQGGLGAEGSHLYKIGGRYYLFLISWPPGAVRTEICYRADSISGPWEGRVLLQDDMGYHHAGVAQGGIVQSPEGHWFAMLFQDHGAVGRIPVLVQVDWADDWPVFTIIDRENNDTDFGNIITSDEFDKNTLPAAWQWNHQSDDAHWSLTSRPGFMRITTGRIDENIFTARNTLTQRMFGPQCTAAIALDTGGMKNGDIAGFCALQDNYGFIAVEVKDGRKNIIMRKKEGEVETEIASLPLERNIVYLRIEADFRDNIDRAYFSWSLDGSRWQRINGCLQMRYLLTHFTGYRFALFNYATIECGGSADFDWFRIQ